MVNFCHDAVTYPSLPIFSQRHRCIDAGFSLNKLMNRTLYMQVLDYDRFSRDDPIGEVCIPISEIDLSTSQTLWRSLQPCKGHSVSNTPNCIFSNKNTWREACVYRSSLRMVGRPWVRPSVDTYSAWRYIPSFSETISMKLVTSNHQVSGHCLERFSRSEVKGQGHIEVKCTAAAEAYISMVWRRGSLVSF